MSNAGRGGPVLAVVMVILVGLLGAAPGPSHAAPGASLASEEMLPPTYWLTGADGSVHSLGSAATFGSLAGRPLAKPVVGMAATPGWGGYWLAATDGGVFSFGDAPFRGSLSGSALRAPIVAVTATESLDPYRPGATGYDISWPQCGGAYPPPPFGFAVVGVGGRVTFTHNPCLASEAAWFRPATVTLYVKLSSPEAGLPSAGDSGPAGVCAPADALCRGYNYGYNLVADAHAYAASQGVSSGMWWLDVELPAGFAGALWGANTAANARVVAGGIDALNALGAQPGVYSNSYQWPLVVGGYSPPVPMWQARFSAPDPAAYCTTGAFTPGPVWLVQVATSPFDRDLAC